ncbi:MAG: Intracellular protease 1 [Methanomassiliicoccales archaeon PtaU1.Bin124]|nr:MAG: Intracellular protease 1 [Methanomassiliicoccales archaeon PtaU1.Bin124]
MKAERKGGKLAILIEDDYEDHELWYPYYRLIEAGFAPEFVSPGRKEEYRSKHGYPAQSDVKAERASTKSYLGVIVPGGFAPDRLRRSTAINEFVRKMFEEGKLIAAICHGPSVLISANVLKGKKCTCFPAIKDDVMNAGARYIDEEVVIDDNLVTSRMPADLPAFMRAVLTCLD